MFGCYAPKMQKCNTDMPLVQLFSGVSKNHAAQATYNALCFANLKQLLFCNKYETVLPEKWKKNYFIREMK